MIATVAAESQRVLQAAESAFGGKVGRVAGPLIDAAQMLDGAWEWGTTGNSDKFGAACGGVILSGLGSLALGTLAVAIGFSPLGIALWAGL